MVKGDAKFKKKFYITTPIYYVNSEPHIGSAYTTIAADVLARWNRLNGKSVFFLTGTDEHGQKIQESSKKEGLEPQKFVDRISGKFKEVFKLLNISNDNFIRTTDKNHEKEVKKILQELYDKKLIYKGIYEAYYCIGCEQYKTKKELVEGKCPLHKTEPQIIREESYMLELSVFQNKLLKLIKTDEYQILPQKRKNEAISFIEGGLQDIAISRLKSKVSWGIELPFDKEHTCYVWVDAFWNYLTGLKSKDNFEKFWPPDVQLMANDIIRVHATIWPALLLSLNYDLPKKLFVHGYFTINGQKMSKSLGNVISPVYLANKYSTDTLRYYLMRKIVFGDDGDFSEEMLKEAHNNELADKLGNLVSRVSTLAEKYGIKKCENKLLKKLKLNKIKELLDNYEFDKALILIFEFIDECNNYIQSNELWKSKDKKKLYELIDSIKAVAILLYPFIPESSEKISKLLNFKIQNLEQIQKPIEIKPIKKAEILFKKIEDKKPEQKSIKTSNAKKEGAKMPEQKSNMVEFPEFQKLDIRIGTITEAKQHQNADKLFILKVDFGTETRQIVAGLRKFYTEHELLGKQISVIMNLKPAVLRGVESQGMLLAAEDSEGKVVLLIPEKKLLDNAKIS